MARLVAQRLSTTVGQVIVENRPGAGGTIAGKAVATAEPDGYTIMLASSAALAIGPALYSNVGYDPLTSFAPIAMVSSVPYVMVVARNTPFKTVGEFIAYAKANPGKLNFGVPNGAPPHMLALMFRQQTGTNVVVVPYRGASSLITDMIGGQIEAGFETTSVTFAHLREGAMRALAVLRDERLPELPDVPTLKESGVTGVEGSSWTGVVARRRHAARNPAPAARRNPGGTEVPRIQGTLRAARRRGALRHRRGVHRLHRQRAQPHRRDHPVRRRQGRVSVNATRA